jgi:hypothetical protein
MLALLALLAMLALLALLALLGLLALLAKTVVACLKNTEKGKSVLKIGTAGEPGLIPSSASTAS